MKPMLCFLSPSKSSPCVSGASYWSLETWLIEDWLIGVSLMVGSLLYTSALRSSGGSSRTGLFNASHGEARQFTSMSNWAPTFLVKSSSRDFESPLMATNLHVLTMSLRLQMHSVVASVIFPTRMTWGYIPNSRGEGGGEGGDSSSLWCRETSKNTIFYPQLHWGVFQAHIVCSNTNLGVKSQ
jgi:hypothetical protein